VKQKLLVAMRLLRLVVVGLAVALLAGVEVAEASKTKNRDILKKKYGIDCGKHCTNKVVEDAAKDQVDKQKKHHEERVLEGAHDEAAVKQFLFEQGLVNPDMLVDFANVRVKKKKGGVPAHTCAIERYSSVAPGKCVPTEFIMEYLQGKIIPSTTLNIQEEPLPYLTPTNVKMLETYRYEAVVSLSMWLRVQQLDHFSNRVQFLLFPTEIWDDKRLAQLQAYKAHLGKLGEEAGAELEAAKVALAQGDLDNGHLTRAHRLKLISHVRFAQMIGFNVANVTMDENADSYTTLLTEETGGGDSAKGKKLEEMIQSELDKLGDNVTEAEKLAVIAAAEEEASLNPDFGKEKGLAGAIADILREHKDNVVNGLGEALSGKASHQTHAYLVLVFIGMSIPFAGMVMACFSALGFGNQSNGLMSKRQSLRNKFMPPTSDDILEAALKVSDVDRRMAMPQVHQESMANRLARAMTGGAGFGYHGQETEMSGVVSSSGLPPVPAFRRGGKTHAV